MITKILAMKRRLLFLYFLCFSLLFGLPLTSRAQSSDNQTIVDPLTISGEVGTEITSSWNNTDVQYTAPFSATAYADMILNLYGVSIPISLNFVNVSDKPFGFSKPEFTFNFRPTWRKWTLYLGTAAMNFSNYTYNGISFNGVGLEFRGEKFRFGGFYGTFNRATTFTKLDDRDAIQYLSDSLMGLNNVAYTTYPKFERKAFAAHIAVGSKRNYVDLSFLRAADNLNSLPEMWYQYNPYAPAMIDTIVRDSVQGKENLAIGLKGHFSFGKHVTFEGNLAASLFTPDIARDEMVLEGKGGAIELANDLMNGIRKTGLFNPRYGSEVRFAGDALLNFNFKPVNATLTYRFVQPNYTSLGAIGFNQNSQTFGGNFSAAMFHSTAFLSLSGYLQRDNLDKKQLYTNQVGSYTINWSNFFGDYVTLAIAYNGVTQKQLDGTIVVPEETRINQIAHSLDVSPSYTLSLENEHTFTLNFNLLQNKNRNKLMEGYAFDVTTTSYGVGYELYLTQSRLSIDANYDYSLSRSPGNDYNSHSLTGGASYNFIDKDDLTLSGNAKLMLAFNMEKTQTEEITEDERQTLEYLARRRGVNVTTEITNDLSVAGRLGASLKYKNRHNASLYFSISNYSDNIIIGQHVAISTDMRVTLEYSYSFASRLIKSKKR